MDRKLSRRTLLRGVVSAAALIPVINLSSRPAWAADKVPTDDPMAKSLNYVEDADAADIDRPEKAGTPGSEQYCHNCSLYQGSDDWGPCSIFQNRLVAGEGWCTAWAPA